MSHDHPKTRAILPAWSEFHTAEAADRLTAMAGRLAEADGPADESGEWPEALWSLLVELGAPRWALPTSVGGEDCDRPTIVQRYARVAEGSLTAAFILSQHDAGARRLMVAPHRPNARRWIESIAAGRAFTTVGISHLTTSRRHGDRALVAEEAAGGVFRLDGVMPWVTGAERADVIVTGAVMADGRQLLIAVPTDRPGLSVCPPFALAALQASRTSEVRCDGVEVLGDDLLAGPAPYVMGSPGAVGTGGLETSALALGQARAHVQRDPSLEVGQLERRLAVAPVHRPEQREQRLGLRDGHGLAVAMRPALGGEVEAENA